MNIEIRNENEVHISGYVNAVERDSRELSPDKAANATEPFYEQVAAGAWDRAIKANPDVRLMFNHSVDIGGTGDGTLSLREDNIGLYAAAVVTDPEVVRAAKLGRLTGWSFGFSNPCDTWGKAEDGKSRRRLNDFDLVEVSILSVTPAYIGTSIEARDGLPRIWIRTLDDAPAPPQAGTEDTPPKENYDHRSEELSLLELFNV